MSTRSTLDLMQSRKYRSWVLLLLVVVAMFGFVDRQIIGALGQPIKNELGISDTQLGLLGGMAFAVLNAVLSIPIARLAERYNRVVIYGIGILLWSAATISCGLAAGFVMLLISRVCVGVGEASQSAVASLVADYYPPTRRVATASILTLAVPAGALLGSAGGGYIAEHADWRLAFIIVGAPGVLLGILLLTTIREPLRGYYDPPPAQAAYVPPFSAVLRRIWTRRAFLHMAVGSTMASAGGFGINLFLASYYYRRFGLDFVQSGILSGIISAIPGMISMFIGGMIANRLGRRDPRYYAWTPAIGALLTAPLYIISLLQGHWFAATAMLMVTGLFQYVYLPTSMGVYANVMEPRMRATATALVGICTNLVGAGAGPLVVGMLSDALARRAYVGNFDLVCVGKRAAETAPDGRCGVASAFGLQWAMILVALIYLWACVHFLLAARTLRRDMAA